MLPAGMVDHQRQVTELTPLNNVSSFLTPAYVADCSPELITNANCRHRLLKHVKQLYWPKGEQTVQVRIHAPKCSLLAQAPISAVRSVIVAKTINWRVDQIPRRVFLQCLRFALYLYRVSERLFMTCHCWPWVAQALAHTLWYCRFGGESIVEWVGSAFALLRASASS
jgi:hypothetical protein